MLFSGEKERQSARENKAKALKVSERGEKEHVAREKESVNFLFERGKIKLRPAPQRKGDQSGLIMLGKKET